MISCVTKLVVILWVCALWSAPLPGYAQDAPQIKAAFVYNFAKFVEWPPTAFPEGHTTIVLGISDREPMAGAIEALSGKIVQGKTLVVKRISRTEDLKKCRIYFAGASDPKGMAQAVEAVGNLPVLTVTDEAANFVQLGAIINLITIEDKIRFEINLEAARRSGLRISSQLLKLAIIVRN